MARSCAQGDKSKLLVKSAENSGSSRPHSNHSKYQTITWDWRLPDMLRLSQLSQVAMEITSRNKYNKQQLLKVRTILSEVLLTLALASLATAIINNELILLRVYRVCSQAALGLKILTTIMTAALVVVIWIFNYIQLRIFMTLRSIDDITTALNVDYQRLVTTIIETIICIMHPLPVCLGLGDRPNLESSGVGSLEHKLNFTSSVITQESFNSTDVSDSGNIIRLSSADTILTVLMFLRLYHVGRYLVLHSKLFRTMLSYSLGALAHTKYNVVFIFKSYMALYKGYFLASFALMFTAIAAWCIYICDRDIVTYQDALWVVGITFFTVGYGDLYPVSRCSQVICVLTGFFGMFCMGISVTILSRYLQLTFEEYCMLSYYMDSVLEKQRQHAAANIIWAAWQDYKSKEGSDAIHRLKSQRKLLKALHRMKDIEYKKIASRERRERQVPLYDMKEQMKKLTIQTENLQRRQLQMEGVMFSVNTQLNDMHDKLAILYRLTRKEKRTPTVDE